MSANLYLTWSDQSLNDLGDDVAMGKASFEREKDRYRRQRNDPVYGLASRHNSIRPTWGFQRSRPNRSSSRYAGPEASIACQRLASTRQRNLAPSRDHEGRGRPAGDARSRRELREIGATGRTTVRGGRQCVGRIGRPLRTYTTKQPGRRSP